MDLLVYVIVGTDVEGELAQGGWKCREEAREGVALREVVVGAELEREGLERELGEGSPVEVDGFSEGERKLGCVGRDGGGESEDVLLVTRLG